jgi:general secretion pathway protein I
LHRPSSLLKGKSVRGFTLIEVMVALAVVAIALPALLFLLFQQLDGAEYLRQRSVASWIAEDKLGELRLIVARQGALPEGEIAGETEVLDQDWSWWIDQEGTEVPGFIRVEINVARGIDQDAAPLHTLVAFLAPERVNDAQ